MWTSARTAILLTGVLAACSGVDDRALFGDSDFGGEPHEGPAPGGDSGPALAGASGALHVHELPTADGAGGSGGVDGTGGQPVATGGAAIASGGAPVDPVGGRAGEPAGGAPAAGGAASGGVATASGGAAGSSGAGGAGGAAGRQGTGGAPMCDPAIQCEARRCFGLVACGNGAVLDCAAATHCGATEFCDHDAVTGTCRSFFAGLDCNGSGSGPIHVCVIVGQTGSCNDCQRAPTAAACKPGPAPDSWRCTAG